MALSESRLRVYVDANVILSGISTDNPHSASRVILVSSELTLFDLIANQRAIDECSRNLEHFVEDKSQLNKLQGTLHDVVSRAIEVVKTPATNNRKAIPGTDPKDLVHLFSAVDHSCDYLVTANRKDFPEGHAGVSVIEPGTLVKRIRGRIKGLS